METRTAEAAVDMRGGVDSDAAFVRALVRQARGVGTSPRAVGNHDGVVDGEEKDDYRVPSGVVKDAASSTGGAFQPAALQLVRDLGCTGRGKGTIGTAWPGRRRAAGASETIVVAREVLRQVLWWRVSTRVALDGSDPPCWDVALPLVPSDRARNPGRPLETAPSPIRPVRFARVVLACSRLPARATGPKTSIDAESVRPERKTTRRMPSEIGPPTSTWPRAKSSAA